MKKLLLLSALLFLGAGCNQNPNIDLGADPRVLVEKQGGTGTSTPSGILYGNSGNIETVTVGTNLTFTGGILSSTGGGGSSWSAATHYGQLVFATNTAVWFQQDMFSSSSLYVNRLLADSGTTGAPGISFLDTNSQNSGIWLVSDDTFALVADGTERIRFQPQAGNNKGIQLQTDLDANQGSISQLWQTLPTSRADCVGEELCGDLGSFDYSFDDVFASGTAYITYATSTAISAETICLTSDCRTSWPTSGAGGDDPFTHTTNYGENVSATTSPLWIQDNLYVSSTAHLSYVSSTMMDAGYLRINAASPTARVHIVPDSDTTPTTVSSWNGRHVVIGQDGDSGALSFSYNGTGNYGVISALSPNVAWRDMMISPGSGKVGFGTLSPGSKVTIQGVDSTSANSSLNVTKSDLSSIIFARNDGNVGFGTASPSSPVHIYTNTSGDTVFHNRIENANEAGRTQMLITNGTFPNNIFDLMTHGTTYASDNYLNDGITDAGLGILLGQGSNMTKFAVGTYNATPLTFFTNNTQRMHVHPNGNVGISTSTPRSLLQVSGASGATTSTIWVGDLTGVRGQICMGDSDGSGASCMYFNDGFATVFTTSTY